MVIRRISTVLALMVAGALVVVTPGGFVSAQTGPETPTTVAPAPQCEPDGSIPPGASSCVDAGPPILPGPDGAEPAEPVPAQPTFTG